MARVFDETSPLPREEEEEKEVNVGGRPPHQPTAEQRRQVTAMARQFTSRRSIAVIIGISENTLRKHYQHELEYGDALGEVKARSRIDKAAERGNIRALIHIAETKLGDTKKSIMEHRGAGGGPIEVQAYLSIPPEQRLAMLRDLSARVLGAATPPETDGFEPED